MSVGDCSTPISGWIKQPDQRREFLQSEHRTALRTELDSLYAHLYGLERDELAYILDTFPIVRRKDEERWGEYRAKRLVLSRFDKYASASWL